jgi:hypothetical protein
VHSKCEMDNKLKKNIRSVVISIMEILRRCMRRKVYLCLVLFSKENGNLKETI